MHTKQQQCIEVQFRLENTEVQLRVWLQSKNKNDWIVLRERRKYDIRIAIGQSNNMAFPF